jgi:hypothetical protein
MSLLEAVTDNNQTEVERLLSNGADVNETDKVNYANNHSNIT